MAHTHEHEIAGPVTKNRLLITMALNFIITIAEIIGGILSGSLALISDALHNFTDGTSIIISYIALKLKRRDHSFRHTFGLKRAEILAAVINSTVLLAITVYLFYEAIHRFIHPEPIEGGLMTIVALIGLTANVIGTLLLRKGAAYSMNIKSAYLHLFADALSSIGVIVGGLAIYFWRVIWIDPLITILIGLYILKESYQILMQAIHILMEGAPTGISIDKVREIVEAFDEVKNMHHVHLWTVGENDIHLEAHVNVNDMLISQTRPLREKLKNLLYNLFEISHVTLQFECGECEDIGLIKKNGH